MKYLEVVQHVRDEMIARIKSSEESLSYGVVEPIEKDFHLTMGTGEVVFVRVEDPEQFLDDSEEYLKNALWTKFISLSSQSCKVVIDTNGEFSLA